MNEQRPYGSGDATYLAAGGEAGIRRLVDTFYDLMASKPAFRAIWRLHPADTAQSRDKLARFLCGWMGGPKRYQQKYGAISIPRAHAHLAVTTVEKDQWLGCMQEALEAQAYPPALVDYLMLQLAVPAEHIRRQSASSTPGPA